MLRKALTTKDTKVHEGKTGKEFLRDTSCPLWLALFDSGSTDALLQLV
jgi:hypothetical protein